MPVYVLLDHKKENGFMIVPQGRGKCLCVVALWGLLVPATGRAATDSNSLFASPSHFLDTVKQDYEDLYFSPEHWMHLGIAFGAGGIVANTKMDQELQDWYQQHIRTKATNRAADVATIFGTGQYMVPVALGAAFLGDRLIPGDDGDSPLGTWGSRATRAYITGLPALLVAQWVTGAPRPDEGSSHWRLFRDGHGISGHSFIGAVPFLTAAQMCEDNPLARYLLYAASALPALARINDNAHYPSQAFLGWFLAWEATSAIAHRERRDQHVSLEPALIGDGYGIALCIRW
jgi:membrane-associated phospholipid phosphatase